MPCNVCIKGFNSFYGNRQNQNSDNKIDLEDDDDVGDAVGDNRNLFVMFHGSSPVLLLLGKLMLS